MPKNGIKTVFIMLVFVLSLLSGCVKDVTVTITNTKAITSKVSFAKDVAPLLAANCATAGCHVVNRTPPNLEKEFSFNALSKSKLIDTKSPESSVLYLKMTGKLVPAMPIGKPGNPSNINNLVLAWIKQGALNN